MFVKHIESSLFREYMHIETLKYSSQFLAMNKQSRPIFVPG